LLYAHTNTPNHGACRYGDSRMGAKTDESVYLN